MLICACTPFNARRLVVVASKKPHDKSLHRHGDDQSATRLHNLQFERFEQRQLSARDRRAAGRQFVQRPACTRCAAIARFFAAVQRRFSATIGSIGGCWLLTIIMSIAIYLRCIRQQSAGGGGKTKSKKKPKKDVTDDDDDD